jgi:group I intron endonuclease
MTVHFNTKDPTVLGRAIRKYGRESFVVTVIDEAADVKEACAKEQMYIKKLNTRAPNGMNMTDGGEGVFGLRHTEATRKQMSESHKGKGCGADNPMFGKVGVNKGKSLSAETRAKISASRKGMEPWCKGKKCPQLSGENHWLYGKHLSEETKAKMAATKLAHGGFKHTEEAKAKMSQTRKGMFAGSKHGMSKVTEEIVLQIRSLYNLKSKTQYEIADMFGLTQSMVSCITLRKNWKHI